jgi:hypothetical protein
MNYRTGEIYRVRTLLYHERFLAQVKMNFLEINQEMIEDILKD